MFRYYLKLGLLSIRGNPILSGLMIAAIAVGIGACMTIVNIDYVMSSNPIPHRSDVLFHVRLDSWSPDTPAEEPNEPPDQVTYLDGTALLMAGKARRQVVSYRTGRVLQPEGEDLRPFDVNSRVTSADFFTMFDVPFKFGSGWEKRADDNVEHVIVLSREINDRVFGGENSVGRTIILNGDAFRVTGVLDDWAPTPKFYDVTTGGFDQTEDVFFPFSVSISKELSGRGNTNCWKPVGEGGWSAFLTSECVWMQFWVELHGDEERTEYLAFLDAYVESQKVLGRFQRPLNNRLNHVMEWMEERQVVEKDVKVLLGLAVLFLVVCLLNTTGLLLAKVLRRSADISLRRALGAPKTAVFSQYIIEAGLIGLAGGLLGVGTTWLGLRGIEILYGEFDFVSNLVKMDWVMILAAVAIAILSALGAALYPTWRACLIDPVSQLKTI
jgi:putative ABC transport system permease protein